MLVQPFNFSGNYVDMYFPVVSVTSIETKVSAKKIAFLMLDIHDLFTLLCFEYTNLTPYSNYSYKNNIALHQTLNKEEINFTKLPNSDQPFT